MPICEGFSLPLATNMAFILAATAAAASRAPVGAASASPVPPEPGPGWSHLLRRLGERQIQLKLMFVNTGINAVGKENKPEFNRYNECLFVDCLHLYNFKQ